MTGPTEIPPKSLTQRYGTDRRRPRWPALVAGGVLVAALLGWAVWAGFLQGTPAISATVTSFDVVSTHEVRVKVAARFRDDEVDGTCLLRATAEDHTIVGELNVTADELRAARGTWIPIRTERRATTATLVRCTR